MAKGSPSREGKNQEKAQKNGEEVHPAGGFFGGQKAPVRQAAPGKARGLRNFQTAALQGEILGMQVAVIMRCDSDSGKKLIKSMVLRTADRQGMC